MASVLTKYLYTPFVSQFLQHIPIGGSITQVLDGYAPPVLGTSERLECLTLFLCQRYVSVRDTVWAPYVLAKIVFPCLAKA